ncbi:MAG: PD-(D/E)XK nuclease family protein [Solirubrobacteraceae bacterium]
MTLTLIVGPANSAKAGEVLGGYGLAARSDALLVVPTAADVMHYQQELAAPGVTLGRVLTFSGLIDELAARARFYGRRLTPLQRERVLQRAIAAAELDYLAGSAAGYGFTRAAGRLIAELAQQRMTPGVVAAALAEWAGGAGDRQSLASEFSDIYGRYHAQLDRLGRFDAETFAWTALDALREAPYRWGATPVFIYGFDDLTVVELDTVETLARRVGVRVTVSLTYEADRPALAARASVVQELRAIADSVTELPALDDHYHPSARAVLHHLERNLFEPDAPVVDAGSAVELMEAGGDRAEAELVGAEVSRALAAGVPAAEIVIVCRSLEDSGERFEHALERYGIRATSARTVALEQTTLGRALLALARFALAPEGGRSIADLITYLRYPGVVAASSAVVDQVEAYVRRTGRRELDASTPGGSLVRPALTVVEDLAREPDPAAALPAHVRRLLAAPHRGRAVRLSVAQELDARAGATVLDALRQTTELDADRRVSGAELVELLESLRVEVYGVPPADAVLVSGPAAIRARRFRRVFITGLCDGEFPSGDLGTGNPLLDDQRRRELALATRLVLSTQADRMERERYLFYACVSRATERVTLSYRSSDEEGGRVLASAFLEEVAALLDAGWVERRRRRLLPDVVWQVQEAPTEWERLVAAAFAAATSRSQRLSDRNARANVDLTSLIDPDRVLPARGTLPAGTRVLSAAALAHVSDAQVVSASALESFASCPVRWLVERQLKIRDLEPEPEPLARGKLVHGLLDQVFLRLRGPLDKSSLESAQRALHNAVTAGAQVVAVGRPAEVKAAVLRGIEAELRRYLSLEAHHGSAWQPLATELGFGLDGFHPAGDEALPALVLHDADQEVMVSGVIDRVDVSPHDAGHVIVRDYKSGARSASWAGARWLADDRLQVGLYMIATERLLHRHSVAGFYQPLAGDDIRPRGVFEADAPVGASVIGKDATEPADLEVLLQEIERRTVALGSTLRRGELTPRPHSCSTGGCRYPGICWSGSLGGS